jgi:cyanate permease
LVAAVLLGGTFMGITALGLIAARALAAENERQALAKITAAFGLGQAIGPVVAGYGFDITGSFLLPSMVAALGLVVATILALRIS